MRRVDAIRDFPYEVDFPYPDRLVDALTFCHFEQMEIIAPNNIGGHYAWMKVTPITIQSLRSSRIERRQIDRLRFNDPEQAAWFKIVKG